jgi:hypothetical protein
MWGNRTLDQDAEDEAYQGWIYTELTQLQWRLGDNVISIDRKRLVLENLNLPHRTLLSY